MRPLRATSQLAVGANQLFEEWINRLCREGFNITHGFGTDPTLESDIVFACGLLTATRIAEGRCLEVVAAPVFVGESKPVYRSLIITRKDGAVASIGGLPGARLAVNEYDSWSGWHGLKRHLRQRGVAAESLGTHVLTGGHVNSVVAVLAGDADVASIDHSVWQALEFDEPRLAELRVVEATQDWPAPPISVSGSISTDLRDRLVGAILALPNIVPATSTDYQFMLGEVEL